jgi:methyl-accepting chemotaxis protein
MFRNMRVFWKQATVVAILLVPLAGAVALFFSESSQRVADASAKIDGFRYNQPLEEINSGLAEHLAATSAVVLGDTAAVADLRAAENHVEEAFGEAEHFVLEGSSGFGVEAALRALKEKWSSLKGDAAHLSYDDALQRHEAMFADLQEINEQATDRARMLLVDQLHTYYLAHVASTGIPSAEQSIGRLMASLATVTTTKQMSPARRQEISMRVQDMTRDVADIQDDLETAAGAEGAPADLKGQIDPPLKALIDATEAFAGMVRTRVLDAAQIEITLADVKGAAGKTQEAIDSLHDVVQPTLVAHQRTRIHSLRLASFLQIGVVSALTAFALLMAYAMTRLIVNPLRQAVAAFGQIAKGDFSTQIQARGTDEPNQVLDALDGMQRTLRSQIESERASAAENGRIKSALDKAGSSVMLADQTLRVLYMNDAAQRMFAEAAGDIRVGVSGFDASRLIGSDIGALLQNMPNYASIFASLHDQHVADMQLGARTMRVCANPVLSADGQRTGTVVEWIDRTQEVKAEQELAAVVKSAIEGDLTRRVDARSRTGFFATLASGFNQLLDNMAQVIREIKVAAQDVARGTQEISAGNSDLSQRTEEQGSSLQETASSMEEMTSTVKQNADNASAANQLAAAARAHAEKGGAVVQDAVRAMSGINESSRKIADIIGVIDEIAFQTNLLALNAAVEAARAGEQGRGFAVVASEVRSLAGRSASAAKEIKELIQDSVGRVGEGSALVTQSGETLQQIVAAVKKVSDVVSEIAAASREQSSGIEQVSRAVMSMDEMTQQNAALVEEAAAASQSMAQQARRLSESVARYRVGNESAASPSRERASRTEESSRFVAERAPRAAAG